MTESGAFFSNRMGTSRTSVDRGTGACLSAQVRLSLLGGSLISNSALSLSDWPTLFLAHLRTFLDISSCRHWDGGSILTDRIKGVCGGFVESAH